MRDKPGSSLPPTARLSILKERRRNRLATRLSTPGLSSTKATKVCFVSVNLPSLRQISCSLQIPRPFLWILEFRDRYPRLFFPCFCSRWLEESGQAFPRRHYRI